MAASAERRDHTLIGIELARFLCAVAVLLWHYQHFFYVGTQPPNFDVNSQPMAWLFWPFYNYGFLAVQIFWCISGYIFFYKYAHAIADGTISAGRFAWLRFSRLYPLHFVTLLLVAVLQWRYTSMVGDSFVYSPQDSIHFVLQLVLASDWGIASGFTYNGPIWSISIELVVYAIFFVFCWRLKILRPWMLALIVGFASAVSIFKNSPNAIVELLAGSLILRCLCFFYLGALTFTAYDWLSRHFDRQTIVALTASGLLAALTALAIPVVRKLSPVMLAVPLSPLTIMFLLSYVQPASSRMRGALVRLGNLTYSSYLIHFPIQLLIALYYVGHPQDRPVHETWFLLVFMMVVFVLADLIYRYFEKPAQDALRQMLPDRSTAAVTTHDSH